MASFTTVVLGLVVGVTRNFSVKATSTSANVNIVAANSVLELTEVPPISG
jgi:hypothetical protein